MVKSLNLKVVLCKVGVIITGNKDLILEARVGRFVGIQISGYLQNITWRNKYLTSKSKCLKVIIMTSSYIWNRVSYWYHKTKQVTQTPGWVYYIKSMNKIWYFLHMFLFFIWNFYVLIIYEYILRSILRKTELDRMQNQDICQQCNVADIMESI